MVPRRNSLVFPGIVIFRKAKRLETEEVDIDAVNSSFLPIYIQYSFQFELLSFVVTVSSFLGGPESVPPCFSTVSHLDRPYQLGVPHNENTV